MKSKTASAFSVLGVVAVSTVAVAINTQFASIDAKASSNNLKLLGSGSVSVNQVVPTPTITIYRTAKPQPVVTTKTYVQTQATITKPTYRSHSTSGGSKVLGTGDDSNEQESESSDE